jgi:hypothetical protein
MYITKCCLSCLIINILIFYIIIMNLYEKLYKMSIKELKQEYTEAYGNSIKQTTIKQIIREKSLRLHKKLKHFEQNIKKTKNIIKTKNTKNEQDIKKIKKIKKKKHYIDKDELDILELIDTNINNTETYDKYKPEIKGDSVNNNLMNRMATEIDIMKSKNKDKRFEVPFEN